MRGVRGATTVDKNTAGAIEAAARELLRRMVELNGIAVEDIVSVMLTMTPDLDAASPASAVRSGDVATWSQIPFLCAVEPPVAGDLPRCLRALLHWNTDKNPEEIVHVYLGDTPRLRPDLYEHQGEPHE